VEEYYTTTDATAGYLTGIFQTPRTTASKWLWYVISVLSHDYTVPVSVQQLNEYAIELEISQFVDRDAFQYEISEMLESKILKEMTPTEITIARLQGKI